MFLPLFTFLVVRSLAGRGGLMRATGDTPENGTKIRPENPEMPKHFLGITILTDSQTLV
ncbi:MAG: hypothetical protein OXF19_05965 [Hyphomicrobiales bacterium]|nr:hypothetical protein [Hyphomicrobiales bacterium]